MFKKIVNMVMPMALAAAMSISWGDLVPTNSLLFFGEPEYPSEQ